MLRLRFHAGAAVLLCCGGVAHAQYAPVDPMPLGQAGLSTMGGKLSGDIAKRKSEPKQLSSRCFTDAAPGTDLRLLRKEHARRVQAHGQKSADAWRAEKGRQYRAALHAKGECR